MKKIFTIGVLALSINAFAQVSTNGLVGYWPFSGNANDISGNSYNGDVNGASLTKDRFGNENQAYHFDGVSNYITLNGDKPIIQSNEFTISVWAKMDGLSGGLNHQGTIFEQRDDDASVNAKSTILLMPEDENGNARFLIRSSVNNAGNYDQIVSSRQQYGAWHYYVATLGADKIMRLYIDGVQVSEVEYTQTGDFATSIDHVDLGSHRHTGNDIRGLFNGDIDDVRIYSRGLNVEEISILYNENMCSDTVVNDTTVYYVSSKEFETISPRFDFIKKDSLKTLVGGCDSIINHYAKYIYNPSHCSDTNHVIVNDTVKVTVTDSVKVAVTDTLIIDAVITELRGADNINTIKVYPNPAKDHITIDYGRYDNMEGYTLKITNSLGDVMFINTINQQSSYIDLNEWNGKGVYFVYLIDNKSNIVDVRKIVIQ